MAEGVLGGIAALLMWLAAYGAIISVPLRPVEVPPLRIKMPVIMRIVVSVNEHALLRHGRERVKPEEIAQQLSDPRNQTEIQRWVSDRRRQEVLIISVGIRRGHTEYWAGCIRTLGGVTLTMFAAPASRWANILRRDGYEADPAWPAAVRAAALYDLPIRKLPLK